MKIYLAVPLQRNRDGHLAKEIHRTLTNSLCQVLSEWVLWDDPNPALEARGIYKRNYEAIKECDAIVAETSEPSLGVGMEVMLAHIHGKKVVCAYKGTNISNMVKGLPGVILLNYMDLKDLEIMLVAEIQRLNT